MLFSTSIFDRFWFQLGPNLAPKSIPKPTQEPPKIDPKSHLIFDLFFDRFFIDFSSIFDAKINQKSIKNQSQNHPKSPTTKDQKHRFCIVIYNTFVPSAMLCCIQNSIKIDSKSIKKHSSNQHPNLHRFWSQLGFIFGGVWEPRWDQIASKIDLQIHQKIDHISDRSWDRFWPILGPNLELKMAQDPPSWSQDAPKSPQIAA